MLRKILGLISICMLLLLAIVLYNTLTVKPLPVSGACIPLRKISDSAIQHMSEAIQFATVSTSDSTSIDTASFVGFEHFLEKAYPLVHRQLTKTQINRFSYVFEWKGSDINLKPIILMAHYDVVPVEPATRSQWTEPAFSGKITDSCIWGRGAADDKSGVISILEATEAMLLNGFLPKRSIYLCFGHNEETSGSGALAISEWLQKKGIRAEMVLDEGGEITEGKIKDVHRPVAIIGVAEKGYASFELRVQKEGGHSSMPASETAIDILNRALYKLRLKSPASHITAPTREFLIRVGSASDLFLNRMAMSNNWLFEGLTKRIMSEQPEGAAMIHTTIVPTILQSGIKDNIIPGNAMAIVNSRILTGETAKTTEVFIRNAVDDNRVQITKLGRFDSDPSNATSIESAAYKRVEAAVYKTIPRVLPTPYLMIGATDSRHYRKIADGVVNFLPSTDSKGFHAVNERLSILDLKRGINFIMTIIEDSNRNF